MSVAKKSTAKQREHLLYAHAKRVRDEAWQLTGRRPHWDGFAPHPLTAEQIARLDALTIEMEALAHLVRPLTPRAEWPYFDRDLIELRDFRDDGIWFGEENLIGGATGKLHALLERIARIAYYLPFDDRPWPPGVDALARVVSDETLPARERSDARAVLGDLLEEGGYESVADVLRLNLPRVDLFVLPYLRGEFYTAPAKRRSR